MIEIDDLLEKAEQAKSKSSYVNYVTVSDIFTIAEAFRELEVRVKAAEAELARLKSNKPKCSNRTVAEPRPVVLPQRIVVKLPEEFTVVTGLFGGIKGMHKIQVIKAIRAAGGEIAE